MAHELERKAKEAFVDDDFERAVDLYSQAIDLDPKNAALFADRAQANIKLMNFTETVADANKAIELDPSLAKAYLRKGIACIRLEEYYTAKIALETGASLAEDVARFTNLIKECDECIAEEASDLLRSLTPNVLLSAGPASVGSQTISVGAGTLEEDGKRHSTLQEMKATAPVKLKYRHEYFQKPEEVVVTIFAKGIPARNVAIDFGEQILSVIIEVPGEDVFHFQPRLFGKIIPEKCRFEVLSTKVEIRLAKAEVINWTSLEFSKESTAPPNVIVSSVGSHRPTYPSLKPKAKDWDKLEAQVKKEEKEEKLDGDAALNKLFQHIYLSADEDMRRAMTKSFMQPDLLFDFPGCSDGGHYDFYYYLLLPPSRITAFLVESNGTVVSTNLKEVGAKKVKGSPPDGMELN